MAHAAPVPPLRPITDDEVATFWRDGVVCLRQVLPLDLVAAMAEPVERALTSATTTDLSAFGEDLARQTGATRLVDPTLAARGVPRGHFLAGTDHWREDRHELTSGAGRG